MENVDRRKPGFETGVDYEAVETILPSFKPEAIVVMSRGLAKTENGWKLASFGDTEVVPSKKGEIELMGGSKANGVAGAILYHHFASKDVHPDFVTMSFRLFNGEIEPHAVTMAEYLSSRGVPKDKIKLQMRSYDTVSDVSESLKLIKRNEWKRVLVVGNETHIPRMKVVLDQMLRSRTQKGILPGFEVTKKVDKALRWYEQNWRNIEFIHSEDLLEKAHSLLAQAVSETRKTDVFRARMEMEDEGMTDLVRGNYQIQEAPDFDKKRISKLKKDFRES